MADGAERTVDVVWTIFDGLGDAVVAETSRSVADGTTGSTLASLDAGKRSGSASGLSALGGVFDLSDFDAEIGTVLGTALGVDNGRLDDDLAQRD